MAGVKFSRALTVALIAVVAAGCSGRSSPSQWLGLGSKSAATAKGIFFSGVGGLTVRAAPSSSAAIVGQLGLHQKVRRSKVANGYAEIEAADGSVRGWVVNSKLIWKLPPTDASNAETSEAPMDALSDTNDADSLPPPAPDVEEKPAPKTRSGASVFDPY